MRFCFESYYVARVRLAHSDEWAFLPLALVQESKTTTAVELPGWDATESITAVWNKTAGLSMAGEAIRDEVARSF